MFTHKLFDIIFTAIYTSIYVELRYIRYYYYLHKVYCD